jgi:carboxylate-amine ligase
MPIAFASSPRPTIGVEIELQLIDPITWDLTARSIDLLELCERRGVERIKAEIMQSMIEIDTEIAIDVKQCRGFLERRLAVLHSLTGELGIKTCSAGTHPFQRWTERKIYPSPRYQFLVNKYQSLARRLSVYGMHVHIGVRSGEQAIAISNHVIPYLPHLLALSASSPYYEGIDTGLQSSRVGILEAFPIAGIPYYFPDWRGFEKYCEALLNVGAIVSLKDLYWFVRPSPAFGTLEFRICDGIPTLSETMAVVALIQALVVHIDEELISGRRPREVSMRTYWIAPENNLIAARDGLDGMIILGEDGQRRSIAEDLLLLIDELRPVARRLDSEEELLTVRQMIRNGSSATRQRRSFGRSGSMHSVVRDLVTEFEHDRPLFVPPS